MGVRLTWDCARLMIGRRVRTTHVRQRHDNARMADVTARRRSPVPILGPAAARRKSGSARCSSEHRVHRPCCGTRSTSSSRASKTNLPSGPPQSGSWATWDRPPLRRRRARAACGRRDCLSPPGEFPLRGSARRRVRQGRARVAPRPSGSRRTSARCAPARAHSRSARSGGDRSSDSTLAFASSDLVGSCIGGTAPFLRECTPASDGAQSSKGLEVQRPTWPHFGGFSPHPLVARHSLIN
jgi:hypothetical protein